MNTIQKNISFVSNGYTLHGLLSHPQSNNPLPGVLFIHGGGKYTDNLYASWQKYLGENGYASFSFYCRGNGTSEGLFEESSLANRLQDSLEAYKTFIGSGIVDPKRICISGSSMGAHVATFFAHKIPEIKVLLLQSAAAYSQAAESLPLNEMFTKEIRSDHERNSFPVFEKLKQVKGKVLIFYGEFDSIIPDEIKNMFRKSALNGTNIILNGGQHRLLRPTTKIEEKARDELYKQTVDFLNAHLK